MTANRPYLYRSMQGSPRQSWILDSSSWIPDSRNWISDSLFVELNIFRIPMVSGIPDSFSCVPDSVTQDSRLHNSGISRIPHFTNKLHFPDSTVQIPLHGAKLIPSGQGRVLTSLS